MIKKTAIILGILLFVGCSKKAEQNTLIKGTVRIAGHIENLSSKVVSIAFEDIVRGQARFSQIIDTLTGNFHFVFDVYHAQDMRFSYGDKLLRLYIEPADSLFLSIDTREHGKEEKYWANVSFSGDHAELNDDMLKYSQVREGTIFEVECEGKSVKQYLLELEQQVEKENKILDRFAEDHQVSEKFIQWARNNILYDNANYLISYKAHLYFNNLPRTDSLFATDLFPVNDHKALVSSMFGLHLWHYAGDRYIQNDSIVSNSLEDKNYLDAYTLCLGNMVKKEPAGIVRDVMVYKLLAAFLDESPGDFEDYWNESNRLLDDPLLIAELDKRFLEVKNAKNYSIGLLNNFSQEEQEFVGDIFTELFDRSENKLIYVDIWATWCGPCRAEMPHLIDLHDRLKSENVEVISICCNSDRATWNTVIKENQLPGTHFFLDKAQTAVFRSNFKFPGYPTYLFVKDGKILSKKAPRPSAKEQLFSTIEALQATDTDDNQKTDGA